LRGYLVPIDADLAARALALCSAPRWLRNDVTQPMSTRLARGAVRDEGIGWGWALEMPSGRSRSA
jgi:hypothetical protein